jgi:aminomethyltransferase
MAQRTALYQRHVASGGKMVAFAGWELPVQYATGPIEEHRRVRQAAGLFDIDHMGQIVVGGPDRLVFLQSMMTANVAAIAPHTAGYSLLCYDDGGVVDDTFIYHLPDRYFVAVNASNNRKDTIWVREHSHGWAVTVENVSESTYMLALQGPASQTILQPLCSALNLDQLPFHGCVETTVKGIPTLLGRTGYTGEDGFELFLPAEHAVELWDALLAAGAPHGLAPIGLAARDSLRLEPCLPLYGQEIAADRNPLAAGLGWAIASDKGPFIGRDALLKARLEGTAQRLVGFSMSERGVPRHGYPVSVDGTVCGIVTSGIYAPTLDQFIGLAYVPPQHATIGTEIGIAIRDQVRLATIVQRPFYRPAYRR